jgi:hypothetical protein
MSNNCSYLTYENVDLNKIYFKGPVNAPKTSENKYEYSTTSIFYNYDNNVLDDQEQNKKNGFRFETCELICKSGIKTSKFKNSKYFTCHLDLENPKQKKFYDIVNAIYDKIIDYLFTKRTQLDKIFVPSKNSKDNTTLDFFKTMTKIKNPIYTDPETDKVYLLIPILDLTTKDGKPFKTDFCSLTGKIIEHQYLENKVFKCYPIIKFDRVFYGIKNVIQISSKNVLITDIQVMENYIIQKPTIIRILNEDESLLEKAKEQMKNLTITNGPLEGESQENEESETFEGFGKKSLF